MNKTNLKKRMLTASIQKHQKVIYDFNSRLRALREGEADAVEEELDGGQLAHKVHLDEEIYTLINQRDFANHELRILKKLQERETAPTYVPILGSVVVTDRKTFFISTSIEEFFVDGNTFYGISTDSPLFKAMRGKRKGEEFSFGKTLYKIKDIY